jgi:hypothetical protein
MFGSLMLDVAIGMALVYLLLSFVAAAVREGIEVRLKERSTFLRRGIFELLRDDELTADLFSHPQISALYRGDYATAVKEKSLPSYIPSRNFALALLDMAVRGRNADEPAQAGGGSATLSLSSIRQNVSGIGNPAVQRVVLSAIDLSGGDFAKAQASIETWFDSSMDRVSGWYKHRTQTILILTGLIVAVVANVDTIRIAHSFYKNPSQRQLAIAMAGNVTREQAPGTTTTTGTAPAPSPTAPRQTMPPGEMLHQLDTLKLPIGWPDPDLGKTWSSWYMRILGWLITGFAISLGAPFWFDLLNRMMVIRSTVKPHEKSPEESSEDRQSRSDQMKALFARGTGPGTAGSARPAPTRAHSAAGAVADPGADYAGHEWESGHPEAGII